MHNANKQLIVQCNAALKAVSQTAKDLKTCFPDKDVITKYEVPDKTTFLAADNGLRELSRNEAFSGAVSTLKGLVREREKYTTSDDVGLSDDLGLRIDNANSISGSLANIATNYYDGITGGLSDNIRSLNVALGAKDVATSRKELLKDGYIPIAQQDAIFTFRALNTQLEEYMGFIRDELAEIERIRTEHAGRLTTTQAGMLDSITVNYAVLQTEVGVAQDKFHTAIEDLTQGMESDRYYLGRIKVESFERYLTGFLQAAKDREKKFVEFEKHHPRQTPDNIPVIVA